MLAKSFWGSSDNRIVKPVMPSMKEIDENAEYYSLLGEYVCLYILTDEESESVDDTDWKYVINEKKYRALGTNRLDYFVKLEELEE